MSKAESFPRRAVHLDFHTMPGIPGIACDFDPEEFADTLVSAGVDYITVFAKCNLGFAYYPTTTGVVHPGLKIDLLGKMVSACHSRKIKIAAYFNVGLDHEHALRRRDWCKLDKEGRVYLHEGEPNRSFRIYRWMCLNGGYVGHLLSMVEEVLDNYPVDGLFMDCINTLPCYGEECLGEIRKSGKNVLDEAYVKEFSWNANLRFRRRIIELAGKKKPGIFLFFNGMPYREQPTHIELEVLPTSHWGYDFLPWAVRYARTLGKRYFVMTGRFHKGWGDFGGLRSFHSLLYDCYNSIANGGSCSIGDHLHPRGKLETEVYDLVGRVYAKTAEIAPWTEKVSSAAEIAILSPSLSGAGHRLNTESLAGASRMLMELNYQFDVVDGKGGLSKYKILVLPDNVVLDNMLSRKLKEWIQKGTAVISSAFSGLNAEKTGFALDDYKISYEGEEPFDPSYFVPEDPVAGGLPRMPVAVYTPGIAMKAKKGAEILAKLYRPYFNTSFWDGFHNSKYTPPAGFSGRPALVKSGRILHFSFPVFEGYYRHAVLQYRTLLGNCIGLVMSKPMVELKNFPSFGQVTVTERENHRMVHLLSYMPELRGESQTIEEPVDVRDVTLSLRDDGKKLEKVYLAPSMKELEFSISEGYAVVQVPQVAGYQMVVFQYAG